VVIFKARPLYLQGKATVFIEQRVGKRPELVWALWGISLFLLPEFKAQFI
jgi:hypothetical protein